MSVCSAFAQKVLGEAWRLRRLMCGGRCLAVQTNLNAAASPAGSRLCSKVFGDQRSNEGRSPNEEKSFSARQSRASHRGGEAAENRLAPHRGGEAAENRLAHIEAAKPLRIV